VNLNEYLTPEEVQMLSDSNVMWAVTDWFNGLENGLREGTSRMERARAIARLRFHMGNLRRQVDDRRLLAVMRRRYADEVKRCEAAISALEEREHG
jgi:hypothetical protein